MIYSRLKPSRERLRGRQIQKDFKDVVGSMVLKYRPDTSGLLLDDESTALAAMKDPSDFTSEALDCYADRWDTSIPEQDNLSSTELFSKNVLLCAIARTPVAKRFLRQHRGASLVKHDGNNKNTSPRIYTSPTIAAAKQFNALQPELIAIPLRVSVVQQGLIDIALQASQIFVYQPAVLISESPSAELQDLECEAEDISVPGRNDPGIAQDDTETQLDELDIDILRLGNDSAEIAGKRAARRQRLFPSTSHPEEGRSQDTASVFENADRYQLNVGDSDHDHNSLVPDPQEPRHCNRRHPTREVRTSTPEDLELRRLSNRERSTNKAKKKISPSRWGKKTNQKRKLPIDELQIVPWSLNKPLNLSDDGEDQGAELLEDPISECPGQGDLASSTRKRRPSKLRNDIRLKIPTLKGLGPIDISQFRMPKVQSHSSCRRNDPTPTYCDGFIGKEAEVTGRVMPVRRPSQRTTPTHRIPDRLGKLTLKSMKQFDFEIEQIQPSTRSKPWADIDEGISLSSAASVYNLQHLAWKETHSKAHSVNEQAIPKVKRSLKRKVAFDDSVDIVEALLLEPSEQGSMSYQSKSAAASQHENTTPVRQESKRDLEVSQQLMMVSAPRQVSSGSDDDTSSETSDGTYSTGSNSENEESEDLDDEDVNPDCSIQEDDYESEGVIYNDQKFSEDVDEGHIERFATPENEAKLADSQEMELDTTPGNSSEGYLPIIHRNMQSSKELGKVRSPNPAGRSEEERRDWPRDTLMACGVDEPSINPENNAFISQGSESYRLPPSQLEDVFWRPRRPNFSTVLIEVDEEIFDSPSPSLLRQKARSRVGLARKGSRITSHLTTVTESDPSQRTSAVVQQHENQLSLELGNSQLLLRDFSNVIDADPEENYIPESQMSYHSSRSYFDRPSQALVDLTKLRSVRRMQSMPAQTYLTPLRKDCVPQESFEQSPSKSSQRLPSLMVSAPRSAKSLMEIARQASQEMGILPYSAPRRRISLPFNPPFKR